MPHALASSLTATAYRNTVKL